RITERTYYGIRGALQEINIERTITISHEESGVLGRGHDEKYRLTIVMGASSRRRYVCVNSSERKRPRMNSIDELEAYLAKLSIKCNYGYIINSDSEEESSSTSSQDPIWTDDSSSDSDSSTVKVYRKMNNTEAEESLNVQGLVPARYGAHPTKYITEDRTKGIEFVNGIANEEDEHCLLRFRLPTRKYKKYRRNLVHQKGSKRFSNDIWHRETMPDRIGDIGGIGDSPPINLPVNVGVKHIEEFNSMVQEVKVLRPRDD
ncbi:15399_t:CDS:2, partial [Funneliformis geosporum]